MSMQQHRDHVMRLVKERADEAVILQALIALEHAAYDTGRSEGHRD